MDKFHHKLPKEELKKFARDVNKKLVASDYKNRRVDDPTFITPKQEKKVRKFVKDFFDRAVVKYKDFEKRKADQPGKPASGAGPSQPGDAAVSAAVETPSKDDVVLSDVEDDTPGSPSSDRKRKREDDGESVGAETPSETPSVKRIKDDEVIRSPSPPPPPPPPTDTPLTEEERSMREQEEALMRENEEAQRLEDEAEQSNKGPGMAVHGAVGGPNGEAANGFSGVATDVMDVDRNEAAGVVDGSGSPGLLKRRKQEVLSH